MFKIVIVEDEFNAQQALAKMLRLMFTKIEIVGIFPSVEKCKEFLENNLVDLVFFDIELEDGISVNLLKQLSEINFHIIFTTSFDQYAIDAIRLGATDYLLKPIDPVELKRAVSKALEQIVEERQKQDIISTMNKSNVADEEKLVVKTADNIHFILVNDIIMLEADGAYTKVTCTNKFIHASKHLKYFDNILESSKFIRTHQSYLVNKDHVKHICKSGVVLSNEQIAKVAVRKYKEVVRLIKAVN